jgi:hypothetical protein
MRCKNLKGGIMLSCYEMNERYRGKVISNIFYQVFEKNGAGDDFRYYFDSDEDLEYFEEVYQNEDPRFYDYCQDNDDKLEVDDDSEIDYEELPYPEISIFIELSFDEGGRTIISDMTICKVYASGWYTAGNHSDNLLDCEILRIEQLMDKVLI